MQGRRPIHVRLKWWGAKNIAGQLDCHTVRESEKETWDALVLTTGIEMLPSSARRDINCLSKYTATYLEAKRAVERAGWSVEEIEITEPTNIPTRRERDIHALGTPEWRTPRRELFKLSLSRHATAASDEDLEVAIKKGES